MEVQSCRRVSESLLAGLCQNIDSSAIKYSSVVSGLFYFTIIRNVLTYMFYHWLGIKSATRDIKNPGMLGWLISCVIVEIGGVVVGVVRDQLDRGHLSNTIHVTTFWLLESSNRNLYLDFKKGNHSTVLLICTYFLIAKIKFTW